MQIPTASIPEWHAGSHIYTTVSETCHHEWSTDLGRQYWWTVACAIPILELLMTAF